MMTDALPPMMDETAVRERYGLRDPRASRRVIAQAGGRKIGGRWMVRADALAAWETAGAVRHALDNQGGAIGSIAELPPRTVLPSSRRIRGQSVRPGGQSNA